MRVPTLVLAFVASLAASPAAALPGDGPATLLPRACSADAPRPDPWSTLFAAPGSAAAASSLRHLPLDQAVPGGRPVPFEYSDGYKVRAKIHRIASFATLPLFIATFAAGQDLYNNPGDESKKGLHTGLAASTGVLFGVNTVTGAWNLWEGRKDPNHRAKRLTHGILMMAADVGFLATAMLAPESEEHEHFSGTSDAGHNASTHRAVALTSMGVATVSYLIMLLGGH